MQIDGKIPEGYVLVCNHAHEEYCFVMERIAISVQCPRCGHAALGNELLTEYYCNGRAVARSQAG